MGCKFEVMSPCACQRVVSYTDRIIFHQMVHGLVDPAIQEKVLSKGEEVTSFENMICFIETLEMAK